VKLPLFQELCEFNRAFEGVIAGLKRMEKNGYTLPETVREWRAEVLSIQLEVNREFLTEFEADLDHDEEWVCKVQSKKSAKTSTVAQSKGKKANEKRRTSRDA
jgi:hypothetical protein